MFKKMCLLIPFWSLFCCGSMNITNSQNSITVDFVDLTRYMGKWYEVASIPQSFQKKCVSDVTAEYKLLPEGQVEVKNTCLQADGSSNVALGRARVEDKATNAKLKVTFVKIIDWIFLFGGNYWIFDLETNYQYAVVGYREGNYAWILSRNPSLSNEDLAKIEMNLKKIGYDTCQVLMTKQTNGRFSERLPLCEVVKGYQ